MDKLRLGIIGAGSVVREIYQHLYFSSAYSKELDIVAVADPSPASRQWFGDLAGLPANRRFASHDEMFATVKDLDAVQVNTPDHVHAAPTVAAFERGLDVLVPKPTAATVEDAHAMIAAADRAGRLLGVDFHKRQDPRIKEAAARYQSGRYGSFQVAVWYMLDKLMVANPNHEPRFFACDDFAEVNTPVSFLTVHMIDAFMQIVPLRPTEVRATGYSQKLPSLTPRPVKGYDLVDTEVRFSNGGTVHIITGWHIPDSAHALTVQSARLICTDGMLDLQIDQPGLREIHPDGIFEINPMFRNFEPDGGVTGYGIDSPGRLYRKMLAGRRGELDAAARAQHMNPLEAGMYATLVLEAAELSLKQGGETAASVTTGTVISAEQLLRTKLGDAAERYLR